MSAPTGPALPPICGPEDFARAFDVSRETIGKLEIYVSLLGQWQPRINLVANATLPNAWQRHVADSAQLVALAPPNRELGSISAAVRGRRAGAGSRRRRQVLWRPGGSERASSEVKGGAPRAA